MSNVSRVPHAPSPITAHNPHTTNSPNLHPHPILELLILSFRRAALSTRLQRLVRLQHKPPRTHQGRALQSARTTRTQTWCCFWKVGRRLCGVCCGICRGCGMGWRSGIEAECEGTKGGLRCWMGSLLGGGLVCGTGTSSRG